MKTINHKTYKKTKSQNQTKISGSQKNIILLNTIAKNESTQHNQVNELIGYRFKNNLINSYKNQPKKREFISTMFKQNQEQGDDFKKKREEFAQNVRRSNRQQIFSKRRNILAQGNNQPQTTLNSNSAVKKDKLLIVDSRFANQIQKFLSSTYTMENFNELLQSVTSDDILRQHYGLIGIRKILSIADNPPIQPVIDAGLVPKMIEYVKQTEYPQLQLQATWALTNVASGTSIQCQSIVDKGGIPLFVELLRSPNLGTVEQAIWAIGNIASDCVAYRDNIIRNGGILNLAAVIQNNMKEPNIIKHGAWAMSNLCRGNPLPKYENIKQTIPLLCHLIAREYIVDKEIIADCCWAISYNSDNKKGKIDTLINAGLIPKIVSFINDSYLSLVVPCIRILGNVSTGTSAQTDEILKANGINQLYDALSNPKKTVRREACWVISNITAGTKQQIQQVFDHPNLVNRILELFDSDSNEVKREICYIFSNMVHSGEPLKVFEFYKSSSILRYYVNLLMCDDAKTVEVSLECLYIILGVGDKIKGAEKNPLVVELFGLNAIDILEKLQYHDSENVYNNVSKLLVTYFEIQDPLDL